MAFKARYLKFFALRVSYLYSTSTVVALTFLGHPLDFFQIPSVSFVPTYTGSELSFQYIKKWTAACSTSHQECDSSAAEHPLPTRLLQIGNSQSDPIRLFETQIEMTHGKYCCLSHCWGQAVHLRTTIETISLHKTNISWAKLPPTFRDAITITRLIGCQYLWIDSLCIIQDSPKDWGFESAKMADVYGNAFVTISATAGHDSHSGLFKTLLDEYKPVEIRDPVSSDVPTGIFARKKIEHYPLLNLISFHENRPTFPQYPLLSRAWTFQEHLLSPRILFFGPEEIAWQCKRGIYCCCRYVFVHSNQDITAPMYVDSY
jgi:hypothetical protein